MPYAPQLVWSHVLNERSVREESSAGLGAILSQVARSLKAMAINLPHLEAEQAHAVGHLSVTERWARYANAGIEEVS